MRSLFILLFLSVFSVTRAEETNHTIYFDSGKSIVTMADQKWLDSVAATVKQSQDYSIAIRAYCDADGTEESNELLAQSRAAAIKNIFISKGIELNHITITALGEKEPVGDNNSEAGKAKNRRALVAITYNSSSEPETLKHDMVEEAENPPVERLASTKLEVGKTLILKNLNFEGGTPVLLPESEPVLKELLKLMQDNPSLEIEIGGHVCCGPDMALSISRAKKVYTYLKGYGINEKRMTYKGYSFDKPIATEDTEEGRIKNRRVEIKIIKL